MSGSSRAVEAASDPSVRSARREDAAAIWELVRDFGGAQKWLGPMVRPIGAAIQNLFTDQELVMLLARMNKDDLEVLADAMAAAQLTAMIDRHFTLEELPEAIRYSETGRARGKIIIDLR